MEPVPDAVAQQQEAGMESTEHVNVNRAHIRHAFVALSHFDASNSYSQGSKVDT